MVQGEEMNSCWDLMSFTMTMAAGEISISHLLCIGGGLVI